MAIVLAYNNLEGRNTRDVLRRLITRDMDNLREQIKTYWLVMEHESDRELTEVWNKPTKAMPKKTVVPGKKYALQTPREFIEGIQEKINRQRGTDLSPKQCDGITAFSEWFSEHYDRPMVVFVDRDDLLERPHILKLLEDL